jgi:chorismate mutase
VLDVVEDLTTLRELERRLAQASGPGQIVGRSQVMEKILSLVPVISQKALDLTMDGLMIEVHPNPAEALSDAGQQLDFNQFRSLMSTLIIRQPTFNDKGFLDQLAELRNQVDSIDYQIIELISSRMNISEKMGEYKYKNNVAVLQMERWMEILRTRTEHGTHLNMEPAYIERLMTLLHQESIRIQTAIMDDLRTGDTWSEEQ